MMAAPTRSGRVWSSRRRGPGRRPSAIERPSVRSRRTGAPGAPPCGTGVWSCTRRAAAGALRGPRREMRGDRVQDAVQARAARAAPYAVAASGDVNAAARVGAVAVPRGPVHAGRARRERGAGRGTGPRRRRRAPRVRCARAGLRPAAPSPRVRFRRALRAALPPRPRRRPAPPHARLGQKARAWRALAKDGRARTKEALGDLELLKTQLEEARAAEARAATLAVRARELEADRRKLRDEIATRDAAQRLGRLERRPSVSPLSPATARRRSPSPRGFRSVAFAEATPPPRASLTPSDESLSSASRDRRDALALRAAELEARQRGVRDALATHRSRTPTPTTTTSSSSSDSLVSRTLRVLRDQLSPERPDSSSSPVEEALGTAC